MAEPEKSKPRPPKVVSVSYGLTVSLPDYESVRFDLTARVEEDERWRDVFDALRTRAVHLKTQIKAEGG